MYSIFMVSVALLLICAYYLNTPTGKGKLLENSVYRTTKYLAKKLDGIELKDLMYKDEVSSSQIDNILITSKALYVIEAKNYKINEHPSCYPHL